MRGRHPLNGRFVSIRGRALAVPAMAFALLVGGLAPALAQEATPGAGRARNQPHPAHIHSGTCVEGELGEVVAPLTDLVGQRGQRAGNQRALVVASSFTNVPLPLDAILAADHAINVHLSAEAIDEYIACGEIGGPLGDTNTLAIGLRQQNRSGFTGIAYLAPGADGASTDVSVFVAQTLGRGGAAGAAASPVASDDGTTPDDDAGNDTDSIGTPEADG